MFGPHYSLIELPVAVKQRRPLMGQRPRSGFTLIELLVTVGIIVLLVSISMPMVGKAWEAANQARCQSNLRALSAAFLAFARDNDNRLPGSRYCYYADRNPNHWDWLYGQYSILETEIDPSTGTLTTEQKKLQYAPQFGTIWKYVNSLGAYRCPSMTPQKPTSGFGSNGRYDYFAFACWAGAPLKDIKPLSQLHYPMNPGRDSSLIPDTNPQFQAFRYSTKVEDRPTPMVGQEDAAIWSNTYMSSWATYCRQMAHCHNGGSFYAGTDGGVYFLIEPDTDPTNVYWMGERLWYQDGPQTGAPRCLDFDPGWYNAATMNSMTDGLEWGAWSRY